MEHNLIIRKLTKRDFTSVDRILRYWFFDFQKDNGEKPYPDEYRDYTILVKKSITKNNAIFFVAEVNKKIVGVFGYVANLDPDLLPHVQEKKVVQFRILFLDPAFRRKGIGTQLVNKVLNDAFKKGHKVGYFFSHERFAQTSWGFHDKRKDFIHISDCIKHNQLCRIYRAITH